MGDHPLPKGLPDVGEQFFPDDPKREKHLSTFVELQRGHLTFESLELTSSSNSFPHLVHINS